MYRHERDVRNGVPCNNGKSSHLTHTIKKIHSLGQVVQYEVANDAMTEEEAFALEAAYIEESL